VDYARCDIITFMSWSESNTEELQNYSDLMSQYEPFGTFTEVADAIEAGTSLFNSYDWVNTGYASQYTVARPNIISLAQGALGGTTSFTPDSAFMTLYNTEWNYCSLQMVSIFSSNVANGVCVVWTFLQVTGIREWIQFFFDFASWALFFRFAWMLIREAMK
jgi:hypothetical protein